MLSQHAPLIWVMSFASHSSKSSSKKEQRCGVAMDTLYNATVICRHVVSFNFLFVHGLGTRLVVEQRNSIDERLESV